MSNTGYQGYNKRRRLINGVYDGFSENNLNGTGVGPYIAPVINLSACPLPTTTTTTTTLAPTTSTTSTTQITSSTTTSTTLAPTTTTTTTQAPIYIWVADTYTCEQSGSVFELQKTITGMSSPLGVMYDEPTDRYYVIDADDSSGNFYWFNPTTANARSDMNYISGSIDLIYGYDFDSTYRKIYGVGYATNGLKILDIGTNTITTIAYGLNGPFNRLVCKILDTMVYAFCVTPAVVVIVDRVTPAVNSIVNISSIPSGTTYLTDNFTMTQIGSQIWCGAAQRTNGVIGVYNVSFTTLITTITVAGTVIVSDSWGNGKFWQSSFYDSDTNKYYVCDIGSNSFYVIDGTSRALVYTKHFTNLMGKKWISQGIKRDPVTNELLLNQSIFNTPSDAVQIKKMYKINPTTYATEIFYPNQSVNSLSQRTGKNELWGSDTGVFQWDGGSYNTDGQLFKFSH